MIPERTCSKCGNSYPLTLEYFSRHSTGFQWYCKECRRAYGIKWNAKNRAEKNLNDRLCYRGERRKRYDFNDKGAMVCDYVNVMRPETVKQQQVYDFMIEYKRAYKRYPSQREIANMTGWNYSSVRAKVEALTHMGYLVKREVYDRIKNHSEEEK